MGIMCKTKKITVEGLGEIEARDLTMEQFKAVREAAADLENRPEYWSEVVLRDEGFVMEVATLSTGIPAERFEGAEMTPSAAAAKWKEAVQYADDAKAAYKALNHEVKVGDQVVISSQTALKGAMRGVKEAGELAIDFLKEQEKAATDAAQALEKQHGFEALTKDMDAAGPLEDRATEARKCFRF